MTDLFLFNFKTTHCKNHFDTNFVKIHYSGVAYVIPWPLFVNQECYIPKCLSRRAVFENSSCEFFQSLFKVKAKGQRSTLKNKGDKFIIHDYGKRYVNIWPNLDTIGRKKMLVIKNEFYS